MKLKKKIKRKLVEMMSSVYYIAPPTTKKIEIPKPKPIRALNTNDFNAWAQEIGFSKLYVHPDIMATTLVDDTIIEKRNEILTKNKTKWVE
jgi:hypothetical protein